MQFHPASHRLLPDRIDRLARFRPRRGLAALAGSLIILIGCHSAVDQPRCTVPAGIGFTPTRWHSWQDGPMAYRVNPHAACPLAPLRDHNRGEQIPIPPASVPKLIPPPLEDEGIPKPQPQPQKRPSNAAAGGNAKVRVDRAPPLARHQLAPPERSRVAPASSFDAQFVHFLDAVIP